jgi:hypothetical protein
MEVLPMTIVDIDPSLNARGVCEFEGRSLPSLNRDLREGRFPQPDYMIGQYRYWKLSTVVRHRERRIADANARARALRETQLDAAAKARDGRQRARAERAASSTEITNT